MTGGPDVSKDPLDKKIGDYIEEGLTSKLKELIIKFDSDLDLSHLEYTLPILTKDLDGNINLKAL